MSLRLPTSFVFTACLALAAVPAFAAQAPAGAPGQAPGRGGAPPPPPQNLQIFPKDIPRAELITAMRGFTTALGVDCGHCHVEEPRDFASDAKQAKKTARVMMQLVSSVNTTLSTGIGKPAAEVTKVQCMTCHRGEAIPKLPPPAPAAAAPAAPPR